MFMTFENGAKNIQWSEKNNKWMFMCQKSPQKSTTTTKQKTNSRPYLTPYRKITSRDQDLHLRLSKVLKPLEESKDECLSDLELGHGFLAITSTAQATKKKSRCIGFHPN